MMRRRSNPRARESGGAHTDDSAQYTWPEQHFPSEYDMRAISEALLAAEDEMMIMSFQISVLNEQIIIEKNKNTELVCKKRRLKKKLHKANKDIDNLKATLEAKSASQDDWKQIKDLDTFLQQMEAFCKRISMKLQKMIVEQEGLVSKIKDEMKEQHIISAQLKQSMDKCSTLHEELKTQLAEWEESCRTRLKKKEELWLKKEDELKQRASQAEEQLKLVMTENIQLQELVPKKKKRNLVFFRQQKQCSSQEERATGDSPQPGEKGKKHKEKGRKWCFWDRKKQRSNTEEKGKIEESAVCDRIEEEGAACPHTGD